MKFEIGVIIAAILMDIIVFLIPAVGAAVGFIFIINVAAVGAIQNLLFKNTHRNTNISPQL